MSSDWPKIRLGDYVDSCLGKMLDKKKNKGIAQVYLGNSNVRWGEFELSELAEMKFEEHEYERYTIVSGDLIICEGGEPGRCAIWNEELPEMKIQKALHRVRAKNGLDNKYLFYWFLYAGKNALLEPFFTGTTIKHLTGKALNNLQLSLPPKKHQDFVAETLGSLDQKIQVNKQINRTLEQMAQAIFKSWFVDFEPVKAKVTALETGGSEEDALIAAMQAISGKDQAQLARFKIEQPEQYNELRTTAELFPAAMQDSELGEIPKGWKHGTFEDLCLKVESGGTPRRNEPAYWGKGIKWLSSGEVRDVVVYSTNESITYSGLKGSSAKLWPKYTTVVAMYGATAGQVCLLADEMASNQACCGLVPMEMCRAYIFILARNSIASLAGKASGSAQQNLNKSLVANHKVLLPEDKVLARFELKVRVLLDAWILNSHECTKLANLRDTLLPKLLSGELSIDKVEQAMEVAQ